MKTDARTRYTQMQIKKSFLTLMRDRPMSKITVKSICELAEINRATFYKYYADPYDLLNKLQLELAGHIKDLLESAQSDTLPSVLVPMMQHMSSDRDSRLIAQCAEYGDRFPTRIFPLLYDRIAERVASEHPGLDDDEREWYYYFIANGCIGVVNQWVKTGMKQPPEELAAFLERLHQIMERELSGPAVQTKG